QRARLLGARAAAPESERRPRGADREIPGDLRADHRHDVSAHRRRRTRAAREEPARREADLEADRGGVATRPGQADLAGDPVRSARDDATTERVHRPVLQTTGKEVTAARRAEGGVARRDAAVG